MLCPESVEEDIMKKLCPLCLWNSTFIDGKCPHCGFSIAGLSITLKTPISLICPDRKTRAFPPDLFEIQGGVFSNMEYYCRNVCHFACNKYPLHINQLLNNSNNMAKLKRHNKSLEPTIKAGIIDAIRDVGYPLYLIERM